MNCSVLQGSVVDGLGFFFHPRNVPVINELASNLPNEVLSANATLEDGTIRPVRLPTCNTNRDCDKYTKALLLRLPVSESLGNDQLLTPIPLYCVALSPTMLPVEAAMISHTGECYENIKVPQSISTLDNHASVCRCSPYLQLEGEDCSLPTVRSSILGFQSVVFMLWALIHVFSTLHTIFSQKERSLSSRKIQIAIVSLFGSFGNVLWLLHTSFMFHFGDVATEHYHLFSYIETIGSLSSAGGTIVCNVMVVSHLMNVIIGISSNITTTSSRRAMVIQGLLSSLSRLSTFTVCIGLSYLMALTILFIIQRDSRSASVIAAGYLMLLMVFYFTAPYVLRRQVAKLTQKSQSMDSSKELVLGTLSDPVQELKSISTSVSKFCIRIASRLLLSIVLLALFVVLSNTRAQSYNPIRNFVGMLAFNSFRLLCSHICKGIAHFTFYRTVNSVAVCCNKSEKLRIIDDTRTTRIRVGRVTEPETDCGTLGDVLP